MVNYTYSKLPTINFNTTPASIARSATGSVYAIGDTTYTTPLNMTLVVGGTVVTSISSDANGLLPDFTLLDRTSCVWKQTGVSFATVLTTSDPVPGPAGATGGTGTTGAQGVPGDVSTWKPTTFYPLNTPVTNPSGDLVKVTTAHTSTGSYDAAKFEATGAAATKLTGVVPDANLRPDLTVASLSATYGPTAAAMKAAFAPTRLLGAAIDLNAPTWMGTGLTVIGVTTNGIFLGQNNTILRWSPNKGVNLYNATFPANTSELQFIYEWQGYVYAIFKDNADSLYKVYRAVSPTEAVPALAWSAALMTLTAGSHASAPSITGTANALVICEQGDPLIGGVKTARIYRTTNGTVFTAVKTLPSTYRHFHCVAADPYNPGHIWATSGDNVNNCFHQSTDHGATWTDIPSSMTFQSVQISFTADKIYLAPDALGQAPVYIMDRNTKQIVVGSYGNYRQLRVIEEGVYPCGNTTSASATFNTGDPVFSTADIGRKVTGPGIPDGATITAYTSNKQVTLSVAATATASNIKFAVGRGERPFSVAFIGAVDPATGIYYGVTNNEVGGWNANSGTYARPIMFMVPYPGGPVVGLGDLSALVSPAVFISQGYVWFGSYYRQLISLA